MKLKVNITIQNYIFRILYLIITFIAVPISLRYLGEERYGVWQTIMTLIGFVSLTNFGVGNGLRNKVTEYFTKKENEKLKKVISSAYISISIISLILLILLVPIFSKVDYSTLYGEISITNKEVAYSFIITISGFLVNFVLGLINSISFGIHKSNLVSFSQLISAVISLILTLIICNTESNLCYIALIYTISNILVNVGISFIIFRKGNEFIPNIKYFEKKECSTLYSLGLGFFLLQIASLLMNTSDNFIVAKMVGISEVANYSIVNKLFNLVPTLYAILLIQVWSQTAKDVINGNYLNIKNSIKKLFKVLILVIVIIFFIVIFFDLITLIWLKRVLDINMVLIISAGLYAILICINGIFVNIQNGLGKIKYQILSYIIAAVIQIPLAYILVNILNLGSAGVMLCKCLIMTIPALVNSIFVIKYINRKIENNEKEVKNDCCDKLFR